MPHAIVERSFQSWSVEACPFVIEYTPALIEEIREIIVDAFYSVPRGGAEVGGVLFGTYQQNRVRILKLRPIECSHATGPWFVLSESDLTALELLLHDSQKAPELAGLEPAGWYHSHTRSAICLTEGDLELYNRFFPKPWQIALVLRPEITQPMRGGFFFRHRDGSVHVASSYREFTLSPASGSTGRPAREEMPASVPAPASVCPAIAAPAPLNRIGDRRRWLTTAIAVLFGLGFSVFVLRENWVSHLQPVHPSASLRATDEKKNLLMVPPVTRELSPEEREAKREREALAGELEQMRSELRVQSSRIRKLEKAVRVLREDFDLGP